MYDTIRHKITGAVIFHLPGSISICETVEAAVMADTDLSCANLGGADLTGANLSCTIMMDGEKTIRTADIAFSGHGECGRRLIAVRTAKTVYLWCGCFYGTPDDLRKYIEDGATVYKKTRTLALNTVLMLLEATNE